MDLVRGDTQLGQYRGAVGPERRSRPPNQVAIESAVIAVIVATAAASNHGTKFE